MIIEPFDSVELGHKYIENMQEPDPKRLELVYIILTFTKVYTYFIWKMPV